MKRCTECSSLHDAAGFGCTSCGHKPEVVDGFLAFAPELAHEGGRYDADLFAERAPLEDVNFWFRARNELILSGLRKYRPALSSFLEIGCGSGYVLSGVAAEHSQADLYGSEIFVSGLPFAAARVPAAELMQMDARDIPFRDEIEVIGAFDVLEHIEEDEDVLREIHGALKDDGLVLISVPQHRWLWSPADDHVMHVRRYTSKELSSKLSAAGFEVLRSSSFVSLLLPVMMLSRLRMSRKQGETNPTDDEMRLPRPLNWLLYRILRVEVWLIGRGFRFPIGGSRFVVARKVGRAATAR
jgi:SAM-dependent methyltransferase